MTPLGRLAFQPTPWTLAFSAAVLATVAALGWTGWRRRGGGWAVGGLELLRLAIAALGCGLLNQPEWVEQFPSPERPSIAVLWDESPSMRTRDVPDGAATKSRSEAIAPWTAAESWSALADRFDVVLLPIRSAAGPAVTDLHRPLVDALERIERLAGVVVASDGDWNAGLPPAEAAARLRLRGVPVFAVPVGSRERLPDLELASLDVPTFGVRGKSVRVACTVDNAFPRAVAVEAVLRASDGSTTRRSIRLPPQARTAETLEWTPADEGDYTLELQIPAQPGEALADNNRLAAPIAVRAERLRVLLVESTPRWEYRYLRNALSRDPGVEPRCLLFHPGLSKRGGGHDDYLQRFPEQREELAAYDVVFLGDVGVAEDQLTAEQCRLLRGLVEQQASGLVFMPGWQGRQFSLLDTPLQDLYPVVLDPQQPGGWGARVPVPMELTAAGRSSLLTRLADDEEDNAAAWDGLPGFQWHAPVLRAKAGAEVLAVHREASNEFGRLPLLATQTFGAGKTLFMGTDGAWRWRKGVEDKYHYRFWGQVVRWMAYQRHMAQGASMRLYFVPDQPALGRAVALSANVMEPGGEPLAEGEVVARITAPSGRSQTVRFASVGAEWGAFAAQYLAAEPGEHALTLACRETGAELQTSFFVQGDPAEPLGRPARPEVLEELARVTRGELLRDAAPAAVVARLAALPPPPLAERRVRLWSHPLTLAAGVALLGVFWIGRKLQGVI